MASMVILALLASIIVIPLFATLVPPFASIVIAPLLALLFKLWELMKEHKIIATIIVIALLAIGF